MTRLNKLPLDQWDVDLRKLSDADNGSPFEQIMGGVMANAPGMAKVLLKLAGEFFAATHLPRRLIELVRLRVAFHNQCRSCMAVRYHDGAADGVDEALVCQLASPDEAPDLTDAERAALRFADRMATDHLSIDDAAVADLRAHFTEAEVVELGMNVAAFVGYGRLSMALDMVDELPERFRSPAGALVTPWNADGEDDSVAVGVPPGAR